MSDTEIIGVFLYDVAELLDEDKHYKLVSKCRRLAENNIILSNNAFNFRNYRKSKEDKDRAIKMFFNNVCSRLSVLYIYDTKHESIKDLERTEKFLKYIYKIRTGKSILEAEVIE